MEKFKYNKTAEASSPTMDSKANMLEELGSLYEKFETRIEERSAKNRALQGGKPNNGQIESLNRLKLHRTKIKSIHDKLVDTINQEWLDFRDEAQTVVREAQTLLGDPHPSRK
ncbi:MAG: hypothetical protein DHS20C18_12280 [Saprospiraceae bacterium]|nr:MAG: hypothetical protein DHS20C18_12280 [Saprospiraceae bacterium]